MPGVRWSGVRNQLSSRMREVGLRDVRVVVGEWGWVPPR